MPPTTDATLVARAHAAVLSVIFPIVLTVRPITFTDVPRLVRYFTDTGCFSVLVALVHIFLAHRMPNGLLYRLLDPATRYTGSRSVTGAGNHQTGGPHALEYLRYPQLPPTPISVYYS